MLDFARKLTVDPGAVERGDVEELRRLGLSDQQILSVTLITCLFNFMTRLADGLGVEVPPGRQEAIARWLTGAGAGAGVADARRKSSLMETVEKVVAYITHADKLLVFRHTEHPEAGIQVPAGTIEEGELPASAVMREAREETGLEHLEMRAFLGKRSYQFEWFDRSEMHIRYFYHLALLGEAPATWQYYEAALPSGPIPFEFFWATLPNGVPHLAAGQGELLSEALEVATC